MANTVEAVSEVHVFAFPFACVFTLAFANISVIDLFSVIDGRNHALECICDIPLILAGHCPNVLGCLGLGGSRPN